MRKAEGVKQKVMIMLSPAAPAALLDYLPQNAGSTWLARCQDLASCPRVAGPPGPSRIRQRPLKWLQVHPRSQQAFVDMEDISQVRDQLRDEADRIRPRRSARQQQNRRSEILKIEDNWDQEIEEVLEEIRVRF